MTQIHSGNEANGEVEIESLEFPTNKAAVPKLSEFRKSCKLVQRRKEGSNMTPRIGQLLGMTGALIYIRFFSFQKWVMIIIFQHSEA